MIIRRYEKQVPKSTRSTIRETCPAHENDAGLRENGRIPVLLFASILLLAFGVLTACANKEPANTSAASFSLSTASETSLPESGEPVATATLPTEIPFTKYKFDLTGTEDAKPDHQLAYLSNTDGAVIFGGETSPYYIDGVFKNSEVDSMWSPMTSFTFHLTDAVNDYAYSMDKTSIVYLVNKEGSINENLTYFDGSTAYTISECTGYFCISSDGSAVAYINDGSLYVWNSSTNESTLITENATDSLALSPTGKYIGYTSGDDGSCYAAPVGGEAIRIGSSCQPIALTDDGSLVYYYEGNGNHGKLCAFCSGTIQVLDESAAINRSGLVFNRDCTQIVFPINGKYYFSMNGGNPIWAAGGSVVDANPKYYVNDSFVRLIKINGQIIAPYFADDKNLCNMLFQSGSTLSFFDEDLNVFSFNVSDNSEGILSEGGKALLYFSTDAKNTSKYIYTFVSDFADPACAQAVLDDKYIWDALLTADDNIYYRNDIMQLYRIQGSAEPVKIDTYVYDLNTMSIGGTSYVYYLKDCLKDGTYTLCCIEDAPGAESVVIDNGVCDMDICDAGLVYYKNRIALEPEESTVDVYYADYGLQGKKIFTLSSY